MTREEFDQIEEQSDFDKAMNALYEESDFITSLMDLKDYAIDCIKTDNTFLAIHILQSVYNSHGFSQWYYYDYTAGNCCTPVCLNTADDVETYMGFD